VECTTFLESLTSSITPIDSSITASSESEVKVETNRPTALSIERPVSKHSETVPKQNKTKRIQTDSNSKQRNNMADKMRFADQLLRASMEGNLSEVSLMKS